MTGCPKVGDKGAVILVQELGATNYIGFCFWHGCKIFLEDQFKLSKFYIGNRSYLLAKHLNLNITIHSEMVGLPSHFIMTTKRNLIIVQDKLYTPFIRTST